jgi:hypothetical protein
MTPVHLTSLLVNSEIRANRVGPRGVDVTPAGSRHGGHRTMDEYIPQSHTYSVPVVREMPLHPVGFAPTW